MLSHSHRGRSFLSCTFLIFTCPFTRLPCDIYIIPSSVLFASTRTLFQNHTPYCRSFYFLLFVCFTTIRTKQRTKQSRWRPRLRLMALHRVHIPARLETHEKGSNRFQWETYEHSGEVPPSPLKHPKTCGDRSAMSRLSVLTISKATWFQICH